MFFIPKTFLKVGLEASVKPLVLSARLMTQREVVKGFKISLNALNRSVI